MADGGTDMVGAGALRRMLEQADCTGLRSRTLEGATKEIRDGESPLGLSRAMPVPRGALAYPGLLVVTDHRVFHVSGDRTPSVQTVAFDSIQLVRVGERTLELHAAKVHWRFDAGSFERIAEIIQERSASASVETGAEGLDVGGYLRTLAEDVGTENRWQYAVINVGAFNSPERMASVLATAGSSGWELVAVYDKASNWFAGIEKGFMLMKRPVASGVEPTQWCVTIRT